MSESATMLELCSSFSRWCVFSDLTFSRRSCVVSDLLLPDDVMWEIFSRLPAKSVLKLRRLSKTWCTRLSSREFIDSHTRHRKQESNVIVMTKLVSPFNHKVTYYDQYYSVFDLKHNHVISRKMQPDGCSYSLVGHCNGLVLFMDNIRDQKFCLLNPITNQQVIIPYTPDKRIQKAGFGYVDSEYKIVTWCRREEKIRRGEDIVFIAFVYSSKAGIWKELPDVSYCGYAYAKFIGNGVFLNGAIHWLSTAIISGELMSHVIVFDLTNDVFHEMSVPTSFGGVGAYFEDMFVLGGWLCIVDQKINWLPSYNIWVMKEYGIGNSWTELTVLHAEYAIEKPLFCIGDEEIVYRCGIKQILRVKNIKNRSSSDFSFDGVDGDTFLESLVSPNDFVTAHT